MPDQTPEIGDRVLYRGAYRKVIGWQNESRTEIKEERGPIIVYQNPETERNTYSLEKDLEYSEHYGAFYPMGLLLSRAECALYAAHPDTVGSEVPQATDHEQAARMLDEVDLDPEALSEDDRETLDRKIEGYWPEEKFDNPPAPEDLFGAARELRAHRQEVNNG